MKKEYGWKEKGKRLLGERSGNRKGKRITVIGAINGRKGKLLSPIYFEGSTNTEVFNVWIKDFLLPSIKNVNKVIIMDNAAFHKAEKTRKLIEKQGHTLLYLPPYSPDLNPIEQKWSLIKNKVKSIKDNFTNFFDCLDYCLLRV
jgi:transposase